MKAIFLSIALSLGLVACAVDPDLDSEEDVTSSATELGVGELPLSPPGGITQSCVNFRWICESNCPLGGGQNILIADCDGVETRIFEQPCSFEGCF